jgi:hypothetical protein
LAPLAESFFSGGCSSLRGSAPHLRLANEMLPPPATLFIEPGEFHKK